MLDPVQEIKDRIGIEDLVGRYVDLKRSGASYKGLCPFHQEKTPSFYVTPSRGTYHCFGCGRGGDVLSFVMEMEKLGFPEALKTLADEAGVRLPERESTGSSLVKRLYEVNDAATAFFRETLAASLGERARRYLSDRRFEEDAWRLFDIGYAPDTREALLQHLRLKGFDDRLLLTAGLLVQEDIGGRPRDRFRGRLMFPICDRSGRVLGFGGRILGDGQPKYLNSPQTEIFDKSAVLFGIHRASAGIRETGRAVLVEGYLDVVRAHVAGFTNVVASLGTAVTVQQLATLSRLTEDVVLALDPDEAGQGAAARTSLTALAEVKRTRGTGAARLELRVARLPANTGDPDELINHAPSEWKRVVDEAVPAFEFYFTQTLQSLDRSSNSWRQDAIDRLLPLIQQFAGSAGWQALWIESLARETGIDARALQRSLPSSRSTRRHGKRSSSSDTARQVVSGTTSRALAVDPSQGVERALLALLLKLVIVPEAAAHQLDLSVVEQGGHRELLEALLRWRDTENYDYELFRETLPQNLLDLADELHSMDVPLPIDSSVSIAVSFHLSRLRYFRLLAQVSRASQLLPDLEGGEHRAAVTSLAQLMNERHELEQQLDDLSKMVLQSGA